MRTDLGGAGTRVAIAMVALAGSLASACGSTVSGSGAGGSKGSSSSHTSSASVTSSSSSASVTSSSSASSASSTSSSSGAPLPPPTKIDLLLVVDNSRSMADKQAILSLGLQDLVSGLLNPDCLDDTTGVPVPAAMQPAPTGVCPAGSKRDFPVITDVHIGMLSSSLGSFGANGCPDSSPVCPSGGATTSNNDHGHLVTRTDPCAPGDVPTYQSQGFLAWDPNQTLTPPGEVSLTNLGANLTELVVGDGQLGCGFESQNESWYRFLVDAAPYATIALNGQNATTSGTDSALLKQRAEFLRPDSLLAIVELTDETDTSIKEFSIYPLVAQTSANGAPFHLPTARTECTANGPNDPCCASCGEAAPTGCPTDPSCTSTPVYTDATENINLRGFGLESHKARYGIEFFYPPSRYVEALTSVTVTDNSGLAQANPIFAAGRSPSWVYYAAIVGVPWQLIARQKNGAPDLINGVSAIDPTQVGGFKTAAELDLTDPMGNIFWDDIAGDPEHYVAPISPFMQESTAPRMGTDPITGVMISPASSPSGTNPINGHEYTIATPAGDIEYTCIFPIPHPIDCSVAGAVCDCPSTAAGSPPTDNPLCDPNPNDNNNLTLQSRAKAYPGLKHLAIAKGLGKNGIVASLCAKQLTDPTAADYAYRPATTAIVDALKPVLRGP